MRQISLLMTHQLFLSGQYIWSQGVVKNGMICIKRGVLEMLSDEDDESPMIAFKEGTVSYVTCIRKWALLHKNLIEIEIILS